MHLCMSFPLATLLLFVSVSAHATLLSPFKLHVPIDPGTLEKKCHRAYEEMKADLKHDEARSGFQCYVTLGKDNVSAIEGGFMDQCRRTADLRSFGTYPGGEIVIDVEAIKNMFNGTYRGLIFSECASKEAQRISNYNSHQAASYSNGGGGGTGMRSDCFFSNSCYSTTSR